MNKTATNTERCNWVASKTLRPCPPTRNLQQLGRRPDLLNLYRVYRREYLKYQTNGTMYLAWV